MVTFNSLSHVCVNDGELKVHVGVACVNETCFCVLIQAVRRSKMNYPEKVLMETSKILGLGIQFNLFYIAPNYNKALNIVR